MDFDSSGTIKKLALIVFTRLRSIKNGDESDLQSVVNETIEFSVNNSIPPEVLLEGFNIYLSNNIFSAAFIYADAAAGMSTGKIKSIAHCNAGVASYRMGLTDEAEKQYELALVSDPDDAMTHSNYGILLEEIGRNEDAEEHFRLAKAHRKADTN
ncbi:MAG: tetratricopeptide repeat protein [Methanosarcinales archaeon]|jgi:tetratricopeptide (TPR) repeat protein|nr:tetratricopeptide repeat protein [Methanosarcinales archaeon]